MASLEADALIAYAADKGFTLAEADLARDEDDEGEVSLDEADAVSGGDACFRVVGGGGVARESDDTYAFVAAGAGMGHGGYRGDARCVCTGLGGGVTENC